MFNRGKYWFIVAFLQMMDTFEFYRMGEVHSHLSPSTPITTSSISNTGHRFLQPRVNSGSSVRRGFSPGTSPTIATVTASSAASSSAASFAYQSVLPIGVESSGVTLPVQRIIEGLPVVTLPGIVAHEVHSVNALVEFVMRTNHYFITSLSLWQPLRENSTKGWESNI